MDNKIIIAVSKKLYIIKYSQILLRKILIYLLVSKEKHVKITIFLEEISMKLDRRSFLKTSSVFWGVLLLQGYKVHFWSCKFI